MLSYWLAGSIKLSPIALYYGHNIIGIEVALSNDPTMIVNVHNGLFVGGRPIWVARFTVSYLEPTGRLYQIRKVFDAEGNRVGSGNLKSALRPHGKISNERD